MQTLLTLTHGPTPVETAATLARLQPGDKSTAAVRIEHLFSALAGGIRSGLVKIGINAVQASGTLTLASTVATNTCVINGVTFTAIASGATGNQFNVGGSDTITAANLAAAINASVTALVAGYVTASSAGAVVTVTAIQPGLSGNLFTTVGSTNITAGGAKLTGGTAGTEATYNYGV